MCCMNTVEPPNNGHSGGKHFVHYSEVVPSSEVLPLSVYNISYEVITDQG